MEGDDAIPMGSVGIKSEYWKETASIYRTDELEGDCTTWVGLVLVDDYVSGMCERI